jgi:hypothetical protein
MFVEALRRLAVRSMSVVVASLIGITTVQAGVSCHKINAKGSGQDLGGGRTEAQIIGGGLLQGTTQASFVITGGLPPVFSIAGAVMFTTKQTTLTVSVAGTFNVATGAFMASGPVTAATGKLTGATGTLVFDGVQDLATGKFVEDVSGLICADLAP